MSTLTIAIIVVFVLGYAMIAMESLVKIDKAAIALLMFVFCWTLYMFDPAPFVQLMHAGNVSEWTGHVTGFVNKLIIDHLGDNFHNSVLLDGAMTIVKLLTRMAVSIG